jgi:endo-1,4-beta-xylanase
VTVVDTTPPQLSFSLTPNTLWPPNHKLVTVTADLHVADNCDPAPAVRLTSVASNELDNGLGDGDTADDIQGAVPGTDDRSFRLRAERSGEGSGRTYTVIYEATDASSNRTRASQVVRVPHSP